MRIYPVFYLALPIFLLSWGAFASSGAGVTYHGRLVDPAGNPVVSSSVQFRLQIKTPGSENCVMYEEIQSKDMSTSNGVFALTINDGSGARQDASGYPLDQIFANRSGYTFPASYCASGTTYAPNPSDGRSLQVYFNDGSFSGWEPVPSQAINFIPMAIESMQVGGYKKENLVKVASGVDTTGFDLTGANFTELMALVSGTSTQFVKPNSATFTAAPQWAGTPSTGNDLANKTYVDAQIAAGLPNFGTAGTYTKVTTDAKGRVSSGTTLAASDIPALDATKITSGVLPIAIGGTGSNTALVGNKVMVSSGAPSTIVEGMASNTAKSNNTFVMRDGSGNIAGALGTFDGLSVLLGGSVTLNGATSGSVALVAPSAPTTYTFTLPATGGTNGYVLSTNGSGVTSWVPLSGAAPLSSLTAATATNSIDNLNFGQTWNWSTATTQSPMTVTANALTTGSLLNLTTSSAAVNSTSGLLNVANTSATTTGTLARFQANSTAGSGMTILNSGNVGVGSTTPGSRLAVADTLFGSSGTAKSVDISAGYTPTANSTAVIKGINALTYFDDGGANAYTGNSVTSIYAEAQRGPGVGATATVIGVESVAKGYNGTGAVQDAYGFKGSVVGQTGSSNKITSGYAGHFSTSASGANTITNGYGVYVGTIGGATNKWSVYASDSTAPSHFAGNVGVGTTTPNALLDVNGTMRVSQICDSTGANCKTVSGGWNSAAGLSSLTAATATDTIDNTNYAQAWNWSTATTQNPMSMTADSLTTGSLLNLTSSSASLNSTNGILNVANTSASTTGTVARIQANSTAGSGLTVLANGYVGVGTTTPSSKLHILETGAGSANLLIQSINNEATLTLNPYPGNNTTAWALRGNSAAARFQLYDVWSAYSPFQIEQGAGSSAFYIKSGGNVGIGTTSPTALLHVAKTGAPYQSALFESSCSGCDSSIVINNGAGPTGGSTSSLKFNVTGNGAVAGVSGKALGAQDGALVFNTVNTGVYGERMRITNSGYVGIGTSSPTQALTVAGNVQLTSAGTSISTSGTQLTLQQTGDGLGTTSLILQNRSGSNGAIFQNSSIDLVDFGFLTSTAAQSNLRFEHRNASLSNSSNSTGEFQFLDDVATGSGAVTAPLVVGKTAVILASPAFQSFGASTAKVGVATATPVNQFDVKGNVAVGTYAGVNTAPSNGMIVSGNVGIGTATPQATLDVNGYARLSANGAAPVACSGTTAGSIAMNSSYIPCVCNGTAWYYLDSLRSGPVACVW